MTTTRSDVKKKEIRRLARTVPTHVLGQIACRRHALTDEELLQLLDAASRGYATGERRREMFGELR